MQNNMVAFLKGNCQKDEIFIFSLNQIVINLINLRKRIKANKQISCFFVNSGK